MNDAPKTRFGRFLQTTFEPENYANKILPLLAVAETIATQGKSPGTTALTTREDVLRNIAQGKQEALQAEEREMNKRDYDDKARIRALQERSSEFDLESRKSKAGYEAKDRETSEQTRMREDDFRQRVQRVMSDPVLSQEDKTKMIADIYAGYDPETAGKTAYGAQFKLEPRSDGFEEWQRKWDYQVQNPKPVQVSPYAQQKQDEQQKSADLARMERRNLVSAIDDAIGSVGATGANPMRLAGAIPGTKQRLFEQKLQNIRNKLTVNERQKLRGQGQISDKESAMLEKSVSILSPNLSRDQLVLELNRLKSVIQEMDAIEGGGSQQLETKTEDPLGIR